MIFKLKSIIQISFLTNLNITCCFSMLSKDPVQRPSASEILMNPYISKHVMVSEFCHYLFVIQSTQPLLFLIKMYFKLKPCFRK